MRLSTISSEGLCTFPSACASYVAHSNSITWLKHVHTNHRLVLGLEERLYHTSEADKLPGTFPMTSSCAAW